MNLSRRSHCCNKRTRKIQNFELNSRGLNWRERYCKRRRQSTPTAGSSSFFCLQTHLEPTTTFKFHLFTIFLAGLACVIFVYRTIGDDHVRVPLRINSSSEQARALSASLFSYMIDRLIIFVWNNPRIWYWSSPIALDRTSPLFLFNSIIYLSYLSLSTHPRICEMMNDGRRSRTSSPNLTYFCICPLPPGNPSILCGLSWSNLVPSISCPHSMHSRLINTMHRHLASSFNASSTSEWGAVRKVVQAGTLHVVGCI